MNTFTSNFNLSLKRLLNGKATTVNVILAFLIANFITLATVIGLLEFYHEDTVRNSQTVDRLIKTHIQSSVAIANRQNQILTNQHHILLAEQREGTALQNLTTAMAEHVKQGQEGGSTKLGDNSSS